MERCSLRGGGVEMERTIIGYGNPLRRDDRAGPLVARHVARWHCPGVVSRALFQLTPELVDEFATAAEVLFVDAALGESRVHVFDITPVPSSHALDHSWN